MNVLKKLALKEIHDDANSENNPVVLIAVTRQQYNLDNFSKFRKYLKEDFKDRYHLLWIVARFKKQQGRV